MKYNNIAIPITMTAVALTATLLIAQTLPHIPPSPSVRYTPNQNRQELILGSECSLPRPCAIRFGSTTGRITAPVTIRTVGTIQQSGSIRVYMGVDYRVGVVVSPVDLVPSIQCPLCGVIAGGTAIPDTAIPLYSIGVGTDGRLSSVESELAVQSQGGLSRIPTSRPQCAAFSRGVMWFDSTDANLDRVWVCGRRNGVYEWLRLAFVGVD